MRRRVRPLQGLSSRTITSPTVTGGNVSCPVAVARAVGGARRPHREREWRHQTTGNFQSSSIPSGKIIEGFADPTSRILLEPATVVFTGILVAAIERYKGSGWYLVVIPGVLVIGALACLIRIVRSVYRLIGRPRRRGAANRASSE